MAERFNLTAQLQLQAPTNTRQVVSQIRSQLGNINANVNVQANAKAISQTSGALQTTAKNAKQAGRDIGVLNKNLSEAARRFGVITLATGTMLSFAQAVKRAVGEAIAFERELVKISQVTGKTVKELSGLTSEITNLATGLGVSSSSLLETSRILAQAGFSAEKTKQALDILAKTTLGPTFDSISNTVEGAIAVLRQFRAEAQSAGGEIQYLESTLDAINSVSKSFAVESSDLITVIRRVGGVFSAAGGGVNELIALFTSVRSTTRESAETISTGLRTIFTRIQRTETVDQLEQLGISLRDAQGQFVGAFEATKRLATGLSALDPKDYRFSQIVEQLGGFRQIGKVIPLIQQFAVAQDALNVAQNASGSVARDAITAQQSLAVQAQKVREEFSALIRTLADSESFRSIAGGALQLASALIKIGEALEPVLPLLTSLLALKIGQGLAPGLAALVGVRRKSQGGVIHRASGGYVPGTGNRDTVPAMLTPGEFVIKKSSAAKLGSDTLNAMNNNRFSRGTTLADINRMKSDVGSGSIALNTKQDAQGKSKVLGTMKLAKSRAEASADNDSYGAAFLRPVGSLGDFDGSLKKGEMTKYLQGSVGYKALKALQKRFPTIKAQADSVIDSYANRNTYSFRAGSLGQKDAADLEGIIYSGVINTVESGVDRLGQQLGIRDNIDAAAALKQANIDQTVGNIFESILTFGGAPFDKNTQRAANAPFDFPTGLGSGLAQRFGSLAPNRPTDAKASYNQDALKSVIGKIRATLFKESELELDPILTAAATAIQQQALGGDPLTADRKQIRKLNEATVGARAAKAARRRMASGGMVDTVPALLTPGEFVVNKSSAQSIGYSNLSKMNQTGVAKFNTGGVVRKYANGTGPTGVTRGSLAGSPIALAGDNAGLSAAIDRYIKALTNASMQTSKTSSRANAESQARQKLVNMYIALSQSTSNANNTTKTFSQQVKKTFPRFTQLASAIQRGSASLASGVSGAVGSVRGAISSPQGQAGLQQLDQVAGSMQSFVFLGAVAASLTNQMSGLDEATKKATNEAVGFATGIVGVTGTLVQMFTNMALASQASAAADLEEAGASKLAAGKSAGLGGGIGKASMAFAVVTTSIALVGGRMTYLASKAQSAADELGKLRDAAIDEAKQKGTDTTAGAIAQTVDKLEQEKQAEAFREASIAAIYGGLAGAAGGALAGAAVGMSGAPVSMGTSVGVGAAVGGVVGSVGGAKLAYDDELARQQQAIEATMAPLRQLVTDVVAVNRALGAFERELADLDVAEGLTDQQVLTRRLEAQPTTSILPSANAAKVQGDIAKQLGKDVAQVTETDLKGLGEGPKEAFELAARTIKDNSELLDKALSESRKTLSKAADLEITGDLSFEDIIAKGGDLSQALSNTRSAIKNAARAEIAVLTERAKTLSKDDSSMEERTKIVEQVAAIEERARKQMADVVTGLKNVTNEAIKQKKALEAQRLAQIAYIESLEQSAALAGKVSEFTERVEQAGQALTNLTSGVGGGRVDFSQSSPAGLDDLGGVSNRKEFNNAVDSIGRSFGVEGMRAAESVKNTSLVLGRAFDLLKNRKFELDAPVDINAILRDMDVDPLSLTNNQKAAISGSLREAIEAGGGRVDPSAINDIFSSITEVGERDAESLKQLLENRNKALEQFDSYLQELQKRRQAEIKARQNLVDVLEKGVELRAKARGTEITSQEKQDFRLRAAQQGLQGVSGAGGGQVRAGDVAAVQEARMRAQREIGEISAGRGRGSSEQQIARLSKLNDIVAKTTTEMKRLSDQSGRASDILGEIDKERTKRETLTGIIEDFVVGGNEERSGINQQFQGIINAVQTGTLQNQTPEQRKATVGMLDRLGDIQLPGMGGATAKQVKQELVFRDAVRMGLDPQVAQQLATATTKEEELIRALDRLTVEMANAARGEVAFETLRRQQVEFNGRQPLGQQQLPNQRGFPVPPMGKPIQDELVAAGGGVDRLKRRQAQLQASNDRLREGQTPYENMMQQRRINFAKSRFKGETGLDKLNDNDRSIAVRQNMMQRLEQQIQAAENGQRNVGQQTPLSTNFGSRQTRSGAATTIGQQRGAGQVALQAQQVALDPTQLNASFDNFIGNFSGVFDNIVASFSGIQGSLDNLLNSITNINMTHTVNVEGLVNIGGLNIENVKRELSDSIANVVAQEVRKQLDANGNTFPAGP